MSQWNSSRRRLKDARSMPIGISAACVQIVDLGLAAVIFISPHLLGGRHVLGRFTIVAFCVITAVAWFVGELFNHRSRWRRTSGLSIAAAAISLVVAQLVPLPTQWLAFLSPRISEILPLWIMEESGTRMGQWQSLSLSPEDTRLALATLVGYVLLFITAVQRLDTLDDTKRIIRWIGCSALVVAVFGIVQYLAANGKFFWVYEYPYTDTTTDIKAGFTSRNHFAHFLVLGLSCLCSWAMLSCKSKARSGSSSERFSIGAQKVAIAIVVFTVLVSLSRGAVLAMIASGATIALCCAAGGLLRTMHVVACGVLGVVMMAALSLSGDYDQVSRRLETFTQTVDELDAGGGRRLVWAANAAAFQASWATGAGAGTHRFIYPIYLEKPVASEFTHAENGYLQVATENGVPGIILVFSALLLCGRWCFMAMRRSEENRTVFILASGIAAALAASTVHSVVDFVWFIPACASVTVLLGACALRLSQLSATPAGQNCSSSTLQRLTRFNLAFAATASGILALFTLFPAARSSLEWDRYLIADSAAQRSSLRAARAEDAVPSEVLDAERLNTASAFAHLANVVRLYPNSARAHLRLAGALLNRFERQQQHSENKMPIALIREAAFASNFANTNDLRDWLARAFGDNATLLYQARHHARRALSLCPLQGEAYDYLAELCFLEARDASAVDAYMNQALLVRPQEPDVLFNAGKRRLTAGDTDGALSLWCKAYRGSGKHRYHINRILAGRMTASNFVHVFLPEWAAIDHLWTCYRENGSSDDLHVLLSYATTAASKHIASLPMARTGLVWRSLSRMQNETGRTQEALDSLRRAYAASPENLAIRMDIGMCLVECQQFEEAEPHLRWCLRQKPNNGRLKEALMKVSRAKMQKMAHNSSNATFR